MPAETGALGFTVACLVAAKLGLKVVDADGAGRAVPSLPQLTFSITEGLSPNPAIVVNQDKNLCVTVNASILPDVADCVQHKPGQQFPAARIEDLSRIIDNLMRPIISEPAFDQFGGLALWIMTPEQMRKALRIRNTLWKAWALGAVKAKSQTMVPFQIAAEGVHRDVLPAVPGYLDVNWPAGFRQLGRFAGIPPRKAAHHRPPAFWPGPADQRGNQH